MYDQSMTARFAVTTQVDNNGNRINVSKGKITEDFMSSFEYLAGRMRDIEIKLRIIIDGLQFR
jgi:hypothetical protein